MMNPYIHGKVSKQQLYNVLQQRAAKCSQANATPAGLRVNLNRCDNPFSRQIRVTAKALTLKKCSGSPRTEAPHKPKVLRPAAVQHAAQTHVHTQATAGVQTLIMPYHSVTTVQQQH